MAPVPRPKLGLVMLTPMPQLVPCQLGGSRLLRKPNNSKTRQRRRGTMLKAEAGLPLCMSRLGIPPQHPQLAATTRVAQVAQLCTTPVVALLAAVPHGPRAARCQRCVCHQCHPPRERVTITSSWAYALTLAWRAHLPSAMTSSAQPLLVRLMTKATRHLGEPQRLHRSCLAQALPSLTPLVPRPPQGKRRGALPQQRAAHGTNSHLGAVQARNNNSNRCCSCGAPVMTHRNLVGAHSCQCRRRCTKPPAPNRGAQGASLRLAARRPWTTTRRRAAPFTTGVAQHGRGWNSSTASPPEGTAVERSPDDVATAVGSAEAAAAAAVVLVEDSL